MQPVTSIDANWTSKLSLHNWEWLKHATTASESSGVTDDLFAFNDPLNAQRLLHR
jgi:hypothetical protein